MHVIEVPHLLENKINKKIYFSIEGITIKKMSGPEPDVFIPAENIAAIRYGVEATYGYAFTFGRQYFIQLKDYQNKTHSIKLTSVYGIRKRKYSNIWTEMLNLLGDYYFSSLVNYYTEMLNMGQPFELAGIRFTNAGIEWGKKDKISWKNIAISNYRNYFMIYHAANYKQQKSCSFANDWNAVILQTIVRSIVKYHNVKKKNALSDSDNL